MPLIFVYIYAIYIKICINEIAELKFGRRCKRALSNRWEARRGALCVIDFKWGRERGRDNEWNERGKCVDRDPLTQTRRNLAWVCPSFHLPSSHRDFMLHVRWLPCSCHFYCLSWVFFDTTLKMRLGEEMLIRLYDAWLSRIKTIGKIAIWDWLIIVIYYVIFWERSHCH